MGVSENDDVHFFYPFVPQERSNDILSHIETAIVKTATVYEHCCPIGKGNKGGVPLTHIKKGRPYNTFFGHVQMNIKGIAEKEKEESCR